jgi:hypothetical protein
MKTKLMVALSALCVASVLAATMGVAAIGDSITDQTDQTDVTNPLLTEQQLADLRTMADELRAIGMDKDLATQLVDLQFEEYVSENLKTYGLTDDEVSAVMDQFDAIDEMMAEIKEVAYEMRDNGSTIDEIFEAVDPMLDELQSLQDQLATTLEGYGISLTIPQPPHEGPEGPRHHPMLNETPSPIASF